MKVWARLSIEHKLAFSISIVFIVFTLISVYINYTNNLQSFKNRLKLYAQAVFNHVEQNRANTMENGLFHLPAHENSNLSSQSAFNLKDITYNKLEGIYRLVSLNPLNKLNQADEFESEALLSFSEGADTERSELIEIDSTPYFRYIQPLFTDETCFSCHQDAMSKVGDVRGGISLTFPVSARYQEFKKHLSIEILSNIVSFLLLFTAIIYLVRHFVINPLDTLARMSHDVGTGKLASEPHEPTNDQMSHVKEALKISDERLVKQQAELIELAETAEKDSRIDPLTGAYNRRHLYTEAPKLYTLAGRSKEPITTAMIDIDHFKRVNDTFGHAIGDECIKHLAHCVEQHIRPYDMFVRVGGEEFLLIMPNTELDKGLIIAERLRKVFEESAFLAADNETIKSTISIGLYYSASTSLENALIQSDLALYEAKNNGRNQTQIISDE